MSVNFQSRTPYRLCILKVNSVYRLWPPEPLQGAGQGLLRFVAAWWVFPGGGVMFVFFFPFLYGCLSFINREAKKSWEALQGIQDMLGF